MLNRSIGNAAETCLIDYLPVIRQAGISEVVIDTRGRTGAYTGAMVRIYRDALAQANTGADTKATTGLLKDRIKSIVYGGITASYFLRGLKE